MRSRTFIRPVRVGLTPTPAIRRREPGSSVAATRNGAAEEKSPGIVEPERVEPLGRPHLDLTRRGAHRAPAARSIRSVWSRVGTGSTTVVGAPSASSPASRTHDFT